MTARFTLAAQVLLTRRLKNLLRVDENVEIDMSYITCAEYQLFIDAQKAIEKHVQPDHWTTHQFAPGNAKHPITGIRGSDAEAFCDWLTQQKLTPGFRYRLPKLSEVNENWIEEQGIGCWCQDNNTFVMGNIDVHQWQVWQEDLKTKLQEIDMSVLARSRALALALDLALDRDFALDFVRDFVRNFEGDLAHDLNAALQLALEVLKDFEGPLEAALDRARARDHDLALARDRARDLAHALEVARDRDRARTIARALAHDRALACDPAHNFAHALTRTRAHSSDFAHALACDPTRSRARDLARARALARDFARARDLARDRDLALALALNRDLARARVRALVLALDLDHALDHNCASDRTYALDHAFDLARLNTVKGGQERNRNRARALGLDLDLDLDLTPTCALDYVLDRALDLDHACALDYVRALNRTRALDQALDIGLDINLNMDRTSTIEHNYNFVQSCKRIREYLLCIIVSWELLVDSYERSAKKSNLFQRMNPNRNDYTKALKECIAHRDEAGQLYCFFSLIDLRRQGKMSTWESIRIVRERSDD